MTTAGLRTGLQRGGLAAGDALDVVGEAGGGDGDDAGIVSVDDERAARPLATRGKSAASAGASASRTAMEARAAPAVSVMMKNISG
jgi:hypothetical protein